MLTLLLMSILSTAIETPTARVMRCDDFAVSGDGKAAAWDKADWITLNRRTEEGKGYTTRVKMLYSATGLYLLFDATDSRLTATLEDDFSNIWSEDCFEAFLWPDEKHPIYFEYEISPLGRELPILVPNLGEGPHGWRPWKYEGDRLIRKAVSIIGGPQEPGAAIKGWRAEVFIPYKLLAPLTNVPPKPGARWRANFYRMDHDSGKPASWDWARVGPSFHEFQKYGTLVFE